VQVPVTAAAPGIFTSIGGTEARVLNQDGTINDVNNAAARGTIVSVFCTGGGQTSPPTATGTLAALPLPAPALPIAAAISGRQAEILYAGPAPGLVGVTQVNLRVPSDVPLVTPPERASIQVFAGNAASRTGVVLWVK
jgi:uncharacterized protein (TIGR03437 family)